MADGQGHKYERNTFPREIAPNIFWFGNCLKISVTAEIMHIHLNQFLLKGEEKTLLIDTGMPRHWDSLKAQLNIALGGRSLDYLFPTHPEVPHCANIPNILDEYPSCSLIGDVRDYGLYYPETRGRALNVSVGDAVDLGGLKLRFVPAILKDLPSSLWAFEETHRIMFVADGFAFLHAGSQNPMLDEPLHRPGECTLTSTELGSGVNVELGNFIIRAALHWSRFVDPDRLLKEMDELIDEHKPSIIASAHGNIIVDVDHVLPMIREMHHKAYADAGIPGRKPAASRQSA